MDLATLPHQPLAPDAAKPSADSYKTARSLLALSQAGGTPEEATNAAARFAEYCARYGLLLAPPPAEAKAKKKPLSLNGRKRPKWLIALDAFYSGQPPTMMVQTHDCRGADLCDCKNRLGRELKTWGDVAWKQAQEFHRIRVEGCHAIKWTSGEWVKVREPRASDAVPETVADAPRHAPHVAEARPALVLDHGCPRCGDPTETDDLCKACVREVAARKRLAEMEARDHRPRLDRPRLDPDTVEGERARRAQLEAAGVVLPAPPVAAVTDLTERRKEAARKAVETRRRNLEAQSGGAK